MSPHIQKIENWNEIIMLLLFKCIWMTHFLFFYTFIGWIMFCSDWPFIFLWLVYLWARWLMISLVMKLMFLLVVPEYLCVSVLACTILVQQLNKSVCIITQTIKRMHGLYYMVSKNICFGCNTKYKIAPGLHRGSNKISCLSDNFTGWVNLCYSQ